MYAFRHVLRPRLPAPIRLHAAVHAAQSLSTTSTNPAGTTMNERMDITAVGAHMRDMALNWQLLELGATFVRDAKTAPLYRLYSLGPRPLLIRQAQQDTNSASISLEVWSLPMDNVGRFLSKIPSPLGLGTVLLDDGSSVFGFIGEAFATTQQDAEEITQFGGWRAYLASKASKP